MASRRFCLSFHSQDVRWKIFIYPAKEENGFNLAKTLVEINNYAAKLLPFNCHVPFKLEKLRPTKPNIGFYARITYIF